MADFEDNPFADPGGINPFADPAVTAATSANQDGATTEEYNPFTEESKKEPEPPRLPPPPTKSQVKAKEKSKPKKKPAAPSRPKEAEPAIMEPNEPPPTYTPAPSAFLNPQDDELQKREEEIARREQALRERERNIERLGVGERPNNFPPFPKFCPSPFKPCFYFNIKVEIPPAEQWKVYTVFSLLIYTWVLLLVNLFISIVGASANKNSGMRSDYLTTMGVAIIYVVLFVPGSLFCWFVPLYHAYKKDSSLSFMWFFFVMLFQILAFVINGIGIPRMGACGFFNGSYFFDSPDGGSTAAGALFMLMGLAWFIGAPVSILLVLLVHRYYRASGKTINQAVEEGVSGAAKNRHIRSAVKSTVSAGVKTAMDNN